MDSHSNLTRYDDVNKEIQRMLTSKEEAAHRIPETFYNTDIGILTLLENLNKTYTEINMALKSENNQALKDTILKKDIKMSMVCETLLETLRKTIEEKNNLLKDSQNLDKTKRDLENKEALNKIQINKLTSELEFKKRNLEELNRIIRDQKDRMTESKDESLKFKQEVLFYKAKISELENLRNRANEKLSLYEKEMEALSVYIKEKEERCTQLMREKKNEEDKNSNIKTKIVEMESLVDILNKKNETKDKNLALCNGELSKLLCENKKLKSEYEKYKESSYYYEGLYNSTNSQNVYLNSELNRMLQNAEYSKDIDKFISKYKAKNKKLKKKCKKLDLEVKMLKQTQEENLTNSNINETSDSLMRKIEDLTKRNEEYKKKLDNLELEKKQLRTESKV